MKIAVINGPNLNMLGIRNVALYGAGTYEDLVCAVTRHAEKKGIEVRFFQSNHEGALIDEIHRAYFDGFDGIVLNPGGYTHTSVALLDAVEAVKIPTVEVHLTAVDAREDFRRVSFVRAACRKTFAGKGVDSYLEALDYLAGEKTCV